MVVPSRVALELSPSQGGVISNFTTGLLLRLLIAGLEEIQQTPLVTEVKIF